MKLILPGWVRERAAEPLFDGDADGRNVVTVLLDVLLSCPRDVRGAVARNVIVSGGTALLPGFFARVREQTLNVLATDERYRELRGVENVLRFVAPGSGTVQCGPWVGASLAASLKILGAPVQTTMQDFEAWCTAIGEGREEWLVKDWALGVD
ncbi:hypothetical protein BCR44DRAFT_1440310 [Catenaria anguillulae PL171]|uniref:Actin family n=1 Tax=Catenaria anguillulae PL171 TaxID=765915 RepID=A0A1Y2HHC8_9FUNG|nr:hypothetical protein BCR44DRAFT_1440310 [Catenaria anguillulae PL171]